MFSNLFYEDDNEFSVLQCFSQSVDLNVHELPDAIMTISTIISEECFQEIMESIPWEIEAVLRQARSSINTISHLSQAGYIRHVCNILTGLCDEREYGCYWNWMSTVLISYSVSSDHPVYEMQNSHLCCFHFTSYVLLHQVFKFISIMENYS